MSKRGMKSRKSTHRGQKKKNNAVVGDKRGDLWSPCSGGKLKGARNWTGRIPAPAESSARRKENITSKGQTKVEGGMASSGPDGGGRNACHPQPTRLHLGKRTLPAPKGEGHAAAFVGICKKGGRRGNQRRLRTEMVERRG